MGLTREGLKARILSGNLTMARQEAIDFFFMFPNNVDIEWKDGEMVFVEVEGLNIKLTIRK